MYVATVYHLVSVINPRRACAARVTVLGLCLCVCMSVRLYSRTTGNDTVYERSTAFEIK